MWEKITKFKERNLDALSVAGFTLAGMMGSYLALRTVGAFWAGIYCALISLNNLNYSISFQGIGGGTNAHFQIRGRRNIFDPSDGQRDAMGDRQSCSNLIINVIGEILGQAYN